MCESSLHQNHKFADEPAGKQKQFPYRSHYLEHPAFLDENCITSRQTTFPSISNGHATTVTVLPWVYSDYSTMYIHIVYEC